MDQFKKAGIGRDTFYPKTKFEPKQAPKEPDLTKVVGVINDFYSSNGYAPLPHDRKLELARAVYLAAKDIV